MRPPVALLAALALCACDKPNGPEPRRDWTGAVAWDAVGGRFRIDGHPVETLAAWDFAAEGGGRLLPVNARLLGVPGQGVAVADTGPDPSVRTPGVLRLPGAQADLVIVRLTRVTPTPTWDGMLYYSTDRHGETARFALRPAGGRPPPAGAPAILVYDLAAAGPVGRDWRKSVIEQIRLDLDVGAGGAVVIHQIVLGREQR